MRVLRAAHRRLAAALHGIHGASAWPGSGDLNAVRAGCAHGGLTPPAAVAASLTGARRSGSLAGLPCRRARARAARASAAAAARLAPAVTGAPAAAALAGS